MNAPFENRNRVAGVDEFGRRSPQEGVTTQSKDDTLARLERLLSQREGSCDSVVEPQGALPSKARQRGGPPDRAVGYELKALLGTDAAAMEAGVVVNNAGLQAPRAASAKAATSNALPDSTDELTASRHEARTVACDPVGVVDRRDALPRIYLMAAVVIVGLAALGAGIAFWTHDSHLAGASEAETQLAESSSQVATRVDVPAQFGALVDPWPSALSGEQTGDAPQPLAKEPSAIAPRGDSGPANQTASALASPTPTFMQAEPVGIMASLEPKRGENFFTAFLDGAIPPFEAPPEAAAKLLPPQSPAAVASPSTPKTAARTSKTAKPSVAAKLDDRRNPEPTVKPASAPKDAAPSENDALFPNLKRAQETLDSLQQVVPPETTAQAPAADKAAYGDGVAAAAEAAAVAPPTPAAKALAAVEPSAPASAPPTPEAPVANPPKPANKPTKPTADNSDDRSEKREPRLIRHAKAKPAKAAKPGSAADAPAQANADPDEFSQAVASITGAVKGWVDSGTHP